MDLDQQETNSKDFSYYSSTKKLWEENSSERRNSILEKAQHYLKTLPSLVGKGPSTTVVLDLKTSQFKAFIGDFKYVMGVAYRENMNMAEVAAFIKSEHSALMAEHFPVYLNHIIPLSSEDRDNVDLSVIFNYKRGDDMFWLSFRAFKYFSKDSTCLGYVILEYTDITDIKNDDCAQFIVFDKREGYIINEVLHSNCSSLDCLTPKELDITKLIAKGMSDKEIADTQSCAIGTVKQHKKHIFSKLGINKSTELVALAYDSGLAPS